MSRHTTRLTIAFSLFLFILGNMAVAQINEKGFSFQGYARDFDGNALGGENVFVRFSIFEEGNSASPDFTETHELLTDAFGVFSTTVGSVNQAVFYGLDWININYFLKAEVSVNNTDFVTVSETQLLSVPYAQAASRAENGVPAGSILPFAGEVDTNLPDGYLVCDGSLKNISDFPELFAAIGTAWGGDGATNFRVPDLRGYFLRGVAGDANVDPNKNSRFALNGGNTGNLVGSYQNDEFGEHDHSINDPGHLHDYRDLFQNNQESDDANDRNVADDSETSVVRQTEVAFTGITINDRGGDETRPRNAYVHYIIKY